MLQFDSDSAANIAKYVSQAQASVDRANSALMMSVDSGWIDLAISSLQSRQNSVLSALSSDLSSTALDIEATAVSFEEADAEIKDAITGVKAVIQ